MTERRPPELLRADRKPAALCVREDEASSVKLPSKYAILLEQVVDDALLLPLNEPSHGEYEKLEGLLTSSARSRGSPIVVMKAVEDREGDDVASWNQRFF